MDVDLAFSTNATHSWGIHSNGINKTQTEEEPGKDSNKRKEMKKLNNSLFHYTECYYSARSRRIQELRYAKL